MAEKPAPAEAMPAAPVWHHVFAVGLEDGAGRFETRRTERNARACQTKRARPHQLS
jgi:hypothetical protein